MNPEVNEVMGILAGKLVVDVVPHIADEYVQKDVQLMSILLMAMAEEYDRAAEIRFLENEDFKAIFAEAAQHILDEPLHDRLTQAGAPEEASLRVSDLNASNKRLRALLVELHPIVENSSEDWARDLNQKVWKAIRASAERRAFSFFPL